MKNKHIVDENVGRDKYKTMAFNINAEMEISWFSEKDRLTYYFGNKINLHNIV